MMFFTKTFLALTFAALALAAPPAQPRQITRDEIGTFCSNSHPFGTKLDQTNVDPYTLATIITNYYANVLGNVDKPDSF
jgi:hypothetical protein